MEQVILVDEKDNEIGLGEKMEVHRHGKLHRAFSVFVFNSKGQMMLQKRAITKYHGGGLWSNTCCSHPRKGEAPLEAAKRRLQEEMGFTCDLTKLYSFIYKTDVDNGLIEHELDHVFVGKFDGAPRLNSEEVGEWRWVGLEELKKDMGKNPGNYTFWFKKVMETVGFDLKKLLI